MKTIRISQQNKWLLLSFLVLLLTYYFLTPKKENHSSALPERIYADTMIPKGFVLIPIELGNAETVSALIDQFGVVDLYSGPVATGNKKVASKVKILRAPLNPNQYAVLVPENQSVQIMRTPGPFWAVVQNHETKQDIHPEKKTQAVQIEYHQGGT